MPEKPDSQNFTVTVNDASKTIYLTDDQPEVVETPPENPPDKGVTDNGNAIS